MAEHLLVEHNKKGIKLVVLRPSIIGTSANEPMPGWTDSLNHLQGVSLIVGMGILRDLPGMGGNIADIIPVDYVANQILASVPYIMHSSQPLLVTQCSSSGLNPTTWNQYFDALTTYQNQFPYDNRAGAAALTMHPSKSAYNFSYKFRNKLPTDAIFYTSKFFGNKQKRADAAEMRKGVMQCQSIAAKFEFFTSREWVFDSASVNKIRQALGGAPEFEMDCNKIQWRSYSMNLGYGIKNYILQEEAVMPSMGYNDVVQRMVRSKGQLLPWSKMG